jgi:D-sedoheptulose 7-phosphate isomerase
MTFVESYLEEVTSIVENLDSKKISTMIDHLAKLRKTSGRLFILGVGGSAANSSHAVNDFRKLADIETYAPTDNVAELTARTNDEGWDTVFSAWLETSHLSQNDCLFILSVGGGNAEKNISKNLCLAIDYAKSKQASVIGVVGLEGGYTHLKADICLVVPSANPKHVTPHAETFQALIWHLMVSDPRLSSRKTKW